MKLIIDTPTKKLALDVEKKIIDKLAEENKALKLAMMVLQNGGK